MSNENLDNLNWDKVNGLMPAIIQDSSTGSVLMLGYMNPEALAQTLKSGKIIFYSRTRQRLWTKGEASGNTLRLSDYSADCDGDSLLFSVKPIGPTCHLGNNSCFNGIRKKFNLNVLENVINHKIRSGTVEKSYTAALVISGITKIAQKVGEEAVETVIAACVESDSDFLNECADLVYHLLVLLNARSLTLSDIVSVLERRYRARDQP